MEYACVSCQTTKRERPALPQLMCIMWLSPHASASVLGSERMNIVAKKKRAANSVSEDCVGRNGVTRVSDSSEPLATLFCVEVCVFLEVWKAPSGHSDVL